MRNKIDVSRLDVTVLLVVVLTVMVLFGVNVLSTPQSRVPTVAFLSPAYGGIQNVWVAPIDNPRSAYQLTQAKDGIYDFGVSSDGNYVAYAERIEPEGLHEIMLLNMVTRQITQVTQCVVEQADCRTPVFRPQGNALAYERVNADTGVGNGMGVIRIWLADLSSQPYDNRPLSNDSQFIGHSPTWSADGNTLAFYSGDISNPGVLVYKFNPSEGDKSLNFIPSQYGNPGTLSPSGQQIIFPDLTRHDDGNVYSYLRIADLQKLEFVNFTQPQDPIDDTDASWSPDGEHVAVVRRYTDERYTRGYQIYDITLSDMSVKPLVVDDAYTHGFFEFDASGDLMVMQRFPLNVNASVGANPQIWVYNMKTEALQLVAENAFHPRWLFGSQD